MKQSRSAIRLPPRRRLRHPHCLAVVDHRRPCTVHFRQTQALRPVIKGARWCSMNTSFITPGHVGVFQAVTTQMYGDVSLASSLINGKPGVALMLVDYAAKVSQGEPSRGAPCACPFKAACPPILPKAAIAQPITNGRQSCERPTTTDQQYASRTHAQDLPRLHQSLERLQSLRLGGIHRGRREWDVSNIQSRNRIAL